MEPFHKMNRTAKGYLSEEPGAVTPHAGICGNESQQWLIYPTAVKSANNTEASVAESMERRGEAKGNAMQHGTRRTQSRGSVSPALDRIRKIAKAKRKERFTALLHHVTPELLETSCYALKRDAAPGIDGLTWQAYEADLKANLANLHSRIQSGVYRALPSRRKMIPKPSGGERPLGIASLEDKIAQRALAEVLNAIYEMDFEGFSYGFRPHRSQHDALDALAVAITNTKVNWILDADIRAFFDTVSHEWLMRFLELRIGDRRVLRLIRKWLRAGIMDGTTFSATTQGTPQGSVISPLLSNVYLHYVFDLWADQWRRRHAHGNVVIVRYADDSVVGFEHERDATRFLSELRERLERFALQVHSEKTRIVEFGRYAAERRERRGLGKPETFTFLGFVHICGTSSNGKYLLLRRTRRDRLRATLRSIKERLRRRMHDPIPDIGRWLQSIVRGYFAYHAIPTNYSSLSAFRHHLIAIWRKTLRHRSQRDGSTWARMYDLAARWLPEPRITHPWPHDRFAVNHPRWKPGARIGLAGICAGGA
jgi:group II intron reverse transcriptase/maturase